MTPQLVTSGPEQRNREEKALRLARWFYRTFLATLNAATDEMWDASCAKAGEKVASPETRSMVLELLKGKQPNGN